MLKSNSKFTNADPTTRFPGSPVFLTAAISPERGSNISDVIMLENVYPRSFSSAVLRRKPELSALCTTRPKIFGHTFDPSSRRARFYRGLKVGFEGLSGSNSSVAGSQSRSTFLSHLAGGRGWICDVLMLLSIVYNVMMTIWC